MCSSSAWLPVASSLGGCYDLLQQVAVPGAFPLSPHLCFFSGRRNDGEPKGGFSSAKGCGYVRVHVPVLLPLCYWGVKMSKGMDSTS